MEWITKEKYPNLWKAFTLIIDGSQVGKLLLQTGTVRIGPLKETAKAAERFLAVVTPDELNQICINRQKAESLYVDIGAQAVDVILIVFYDMIKNYLPEVAPEDPPL